MIFKSSYDPEDKKDFRNFGDSKIWLSKSVIKNNISKQELTNIWCRYQVLSSIYEMDIPKNHLMFHMNDRARYIGNPWAYAAFLDESLNKKLKACLRLCHQQKFESRAFARISHVLAETMEGR